MPRSGTPRRIRPSVPNLPPEGVSSLRGTCVPGSTSGKRRGYLTVVPFDARLFLGVGSVNGVTALPLTESTAAFVSRTTIFSRTAWPAAIFGRWHVRRVEERLQPRAERILIRPPRKVSFSFAPLTEAVPLLPIVAT